MNGCRSVETLIEYCKDLETGASGSESKVGKVTKFPFHEAYWQPYIHDGWHAPKSCIYC